MKRQQAEEHAGDSKQISVARAIVSFAAKYCRCAFGCDSIKSFSNVRCGSLFASMAAHSKLTLPEQKTSAERAYCGNLEVWRPFPNV
jgi:hypothetical protein